MDQGKQELFSVKEFFIIFLNFFSYGGSGYDTMGQQGSKDFGSSYSASGSAGSSKAALAAAAAANASAMGSSSNAPGKGEYDCCPLFSYLRSLY